MSNEKKIRPKLKVLYTHQGTLPVYRMGLVKSLIQYGDSHNVHFDFVFDLNVNTREKLGNPDLSTVADGNLILSSTFYFGGIIKIQSWIKNVFKSDVIIIENCINNLTNILLVAVNPLLRKKIVVLGHDDFSFYNKRPFSTLKSFVWNRSAHGFLFYTFWEAKSNKTIKIKRAFYNNFNDEVSQKTVEAAFLKRDQIKTTLKIPLDKKVILYVGRMDKTKGFDSTWCEAISAIANTMNIHFVFVGFQKSEFVNSAYFKDNSITYQGFLSDSNKLTEYFAVADAYIHPGTIGLGPTRAIQHGLMPICFGLKKHNPEVAYCDSRNTLFINQASDLEWALPIAINSSSNWPERLRVMSSLNWLSNESSSKKIIDFVTQIAGTR